MIETGTLEATSANGRGTITFGHPKSNSLPGVLLRDLAKQIQTYGEDPTVKVVVLKSLGEKTFCAGASFDELLAVTNLEESKEFFSGFAKVISAIRECPKFVICRIQGKVVGGGVGIASAADYAIATENASAKLSELALGFGPFIIGPAVERKIGFPHFGSMSIDTEWKDAIWCHRVGLYAKLVSTIEELDQAVEELASRLAQSNPEAVRQLKEILWKGTEDWSSLLNSRVNITSELALTEFVQSKIQSFRAK